MGTDYSYRMERLVDELNKEIEGLKAEIRELSKENRTLAQELGSRPEFPVEGW